MEEGELCPAMPGGWETDEIGPVDKVGRSGESHPPRPSRRPFAIDICHRHVMRALFFIGASKLGLTLGPQTV